MLPVVAVRGIFKRLNTIIIVSWGGACREHFSETAAINCICTLLGVGLSLPMSFASDQRHQAAQTLSLNSSDLREAVK
jgi:hypothetical protein